MTEIGAALLLRPVALQRRARDIATPAPAGFPSFSAIFRKRKNGPETAS